MQRDPLELALISLANHGVAFAGGRQLAATHPHHPQPLLAYDPSHSFHFCHLTCHFRIFTQRIKKKARGMKKSTYVSMKIVTKSLPLTNTDLTSTIAR